MTVGPLWPAWAAVGALADVLVVPQLGLGAARPSICMAILALSWLRRITGTGAIAAAWGVGLGRDLLSAGPFGLNGLSFVLMAAAALELKKNLFTQRVGARFGLVAAAAALDVWTLAAAAVLEGGRAGFVEAAAGGAASGAITAAGAVLIPYLCRRAARWVRDGYTRLAWS
jgi:rod shape-determining protein MreD